MKNKHILYVYGTLRKGETKPVKVPGHLYNLGWFPGATILTPECGSFFNAERIEVDDERLAQLDHYEGYNENDHTTSLYIRRPYLDGWIYEYNRDLSRAPRIASGDWLNYREAAEQGAA